MPKTRFHCRGFEPKTLGNRGFLGQGFLFTQHLDSKPSFQLVSVYSTDAPVNEGRGFPFTVLFTRASHCLHQFTNSSWDWDLFSFSEILIVHTRELVTTQISSGVAVFFVLWQYSELEAWNIKSFISMYRSCIHMQNLHAVSCRQRGHHAYWEDHDMCRRIPNMHSWQAGPLVYLKRASVLWQIGMSSTGRNAWDLGIVSIKKK